MTWISFINSHQNITDGKLKIYCKTQQWQGGQNIKNKTDLYINSNTFFYIYSQGGQITQHYRTNKSRDSKFSLLFELQYYKKKNPYDNASTKNSQKKSTK